MHQNHGFRNTGPYDASRSSWRTLKEDWKDGALSTSDLSLACSYNANLYYALVSHPLNSILYTKYQITARSDGNSKRPSFTLPMPSFCDLEAQNRLILHLHAASIWWDRFWMACRKCQGRVWLRKRSLFVTSGWTRRCCTRQSSRNACLTSSLTLFELF